VLEDNYRYKMRYSPDYQGVDTEAVRRARHAARARSLSHVATT
jgi:hypothetical protein